MINRQEFTSMFYNIMLYLLPTISSVFGIKYQQHYFIDDTALEILSLLLKLIYSINCEVSGILHGNQKIYILLNFTRYELIHTNQ